MNPTFFTVIKTENGENNLRRADKPKQVTKPVIKAEVAIPVRKVSDQNLGTSRGSHSDFDEDSFAIS